MGALCLRFDCFIVGVFYCRRRRHVRSLHPRGSFLLHHPGGHIHEYFLFILRVDDTISMCGFVLSGNDDALIFLFSDKRTKNSLYTIVLCWWLRVDNNKNRLADKHPAHLTPISRSQLCGVTSCAAAAATGILVCGPIFCHHNFTAPNPPNFACP